MTFFLRKMFSFVSYYINVIIYLYNCPIKGIVGGPGPKGDNGEAGKAVSIQKSILVQIN